MMEVMCVCHASCNLMSHAVWADLDISCSHRFEKLATGLQVASHSTALSYTKTSVPIPKYERHPSARERAVRDVYFQKR